MVKKYGLLVYAPTKATHVKTSQSSNGTTTTSSSNSTPYYTGLSKIPKSLSKKTTSPIIRYTTKGSSAYDAPLVHALSKMAKTSALAVGGGKATAKKNADCTNTNLKKLLLQKLHLIKVPIIAILYLQKLIMGAYLYYIPLVKHYYFIRFLHRC